MRFADSERSMARGMRRGMSEDPEAAVRGPEQSCIKGVSCGAGGEDCQVMSVVRSRGCLWMTQGRLGRNLTTTKLGNYIEVLEASTATSPRKCIFLRTCGQACKYIHVHVVDSS